VIIEDFEGEFLDLTISGSGDITVDGHTEELEIRISGSGDINTRELTAREATSAARAMCGFTPMNFWMPASPAVAISATTVTRITWTEESADQGISEKDDNDLRKISPTPVFRKSASGTAAGRCARRFFWVFRPFR
jgi:hypothetical protein